MASELEDDDKLEQQEGTELPEGEAPQGEDHDEHVGGTDEHVDDASITDEEREAIRASRREERRARKDRAREREQTYLRQISSLSRQNQDMALRLANLEKRQVGVDLARVDGALESAMGEAEYWKQQIAVNAARGAEGAADLAEAQDKLYQARRRAENLAGMKQAAARQAQAPAPLDTSVQRAAQAWADKNRWYDPDLRDADSKVVRALDSQVESEGFDPRTPEYWEELDSRIKKYLPHRFAGRRTERGVDSGKETGYNNRHESGSPVSGSEREVQGKRSPENYPLSAERVQAMKDAGFWDDPKARARMVKRYMEIDKQMAQH